MQLKLDAMQGVSLLQVCSPNVLNIGERREERGNANGNEEEGRTRDEDPTKGVVPGLYGVLMSSKMGLMIPNNY